MARMLRAARLVFALLLTLRGAEPARDPAVQPGLRWRSPTSPAFPQSGNVVPGFSYKKVESAKTEKAYFAAVVDPCDPDASCVPGQNLFLQRGFFDQYLICIA